MPAAQYAQSTNDFISKLEIALKECYESEYWLELLFETGYVEYADFFLKYYQTKKYLNKKTRGRPLVHPDNGISAKDLKSLYSIYYNYFIKSTI